jgi:hypothetical protein
MKDQVHARSVVRQIIHSEELQHSRAFATLALRIELTYAHQLTWRVLGIRLPHSTPYHCWKPVEVTHAKQLPQSVLHFSRDTFPQPGERPDFGACSVGGN